MLRQEFSDDAPANYCRYLFLTAIGEKQAAWDAAQLFSSDTRSYVLFVASNRLTYEHDPVEALAAFDRIVGAETSDCYTTLARAHLVNNIPGKEAEAREMVLDTHIEGS